METREENRSEGETTVDGIETMKVVELKERDYSGWAYPPTVIKTNCEIGSGRYAVEKEKRTNSLTVAKMKIPKKLGQCQEQKP